jgi:hypothetical protein
MKPTRLAVVLPLVALPATVFAQIVEGPGHKVGARMVFQPSAGLETGYISNVFYETSDEDPVGSGVLRVLAALQLSSSADVTAASAAAAETGGADFSFRGDVKLAYQEYLTSNDAAQAQRDLGINADLRLAWAPGPAVTAFVSEQFLRDTRPQNFESFGKSTRDVNRFGVGIRWRPVGRTIWGTLSYTNLIDNFEQDSFNFADRIQHTIGLKLEWQYLPVTRFYFEASQGIYGSLGDGELAGTQYKVPSYPLHAEIGARSAITEITSVKAYFGWSTGFYDFGESYNAPTYGAEFGWQYTPVGRLEIGGERLFSDSINANFFGDYRVYGRVAQQVAVITLTGELNYRHRTYEGIPDAITTMVDTRTDDIITATAEARYHYREQFAVVAHYGVISDSTDFAAPAAPGSTDDPSYVRHEVTIGAHAAF